MTGKYNKNMPKNSSRLSARRSRRRTEHRSYSRLCELGGPLHVVLNRWKNCVS